ncbi:ABC transporter substrate-binding protein [Rhizobium sp. P007]|jgi:branched-chain amino acid transport system substrate-binding protein|uniref:ABC transporter substrate-binding protein n=1 Tax=Rhizobium sp. P007 TaxID=285908 RepID=UPI00115A99E0|nr:ABC transporter substrate-binding protein [Rhizobium sp. P007]CAD7045481.1 ABC transporter substrate-binding protein [Rhizobium sp. P007]
MGSKYVRKTILALAALAGVHGPAAFAADTYDIDVVLPLTGGAAFLGKAEQQALMLFEKTVQETGGIHGKSLRFVYHDDQSSPQTTVQLVNQIKAASPTVVIGSSVVALCNAMAPLMRNGPVMYCLSPSIDPKPDGFVFSSSISTAGLAGGLLRYFNERGWKKVALITSTDATGQDAYRNITRIVGSGELEGLELVAEAQFNPSDVSASAQVQRIKGANPDAVIAWSTGGPIGTVLKAIRDAGLDVPVGTTDGNMTYAQMTQYASFLPKELYIPAPDWLKNERREHPAEVLAAKDAFFKAFESTDIKPDGPSTFAWDPALLVVSALRALPPEASAEDLRAYLANLQGFGGINGVYDFKKDPQRGVDKSNVVVTRWDPQIGTWAVVSEPGGRLTKP